MGYRTILPSNSNGQRVGIQAGEAVAFPAGRAAFPDRTAVASLAP